LPKVAERDWNFLPSMTTSLALRLLPKGRGLGGLAFAADAHRFQCAAFGGFLMLRGGSEGGTGEQG